VSFAAVTLCIVSQRVFFYFVIDSVRKLLYTPSYKVQAGQFKLPTDTGSLDPERGVSTFHCVYVVITETSRGLTF
jgi:hypothetical protein